MAGGCIDLYTSRRVYNLRAKYWKVDDTTKDYAKLTHKSIPSGVFYCKIESALNNEKNDINNTFRFDMNTIQIKTEDNIKDLNSDDLVKLNDTLYIVDSVQKVINQRTTYGSRPHYMYYISLRAN